LHQALDMQNGNKKTLKTENQAIVSKLCPQLLTSKSIELDNLKAEWSAKLADQVARHKQELATEKERAYQVP